MPIKDGLSALARVGLPIAGAAIADGLGANIGANIAGEFFPDATTQKRSKLLDLQVKGAEQSLALGKVKGERATTTFDQTQTEFKRRLALEEAKQFGNNITASMRQHITSAAVDHDFEITSQEGWNRITNSPAYMNDHALHTSLMMLHAGRKDLFKTNIERFGMTLVGEDEGDLQLKLPNGELVNFNEDNIPEWIASTMRGTSDEIMAEKTRQVWSDDLRTEQLTKGSDMVMAAGITNSPSAANAIAKDVMSSIPPERMKLLGISNGLAKFQQAERMGDATMKAETAEQMFELQEGTNISLVPDPVDPESLNGMRFRIPVDSQEADLWRQGNIGKQTNFDESDGFLYVRADDFGEATQRAIGFDAMMRRKVEQLRPAPDMVKMRNNAVAQGDLWFSNALSSPPGIAAYEKFKADPRFASLFHDPDGEGMVPAEGKEAAVHTAFKRYLSGEFNAKPVAGPSKPVGKGRTAEQEAADLLGQTPATAETLKTGKTIEGTRAGHGAAGVQASEELRRLQAEGAPASELMEAAKLFRFGPVGAAVQGVPAVAEGLSKFLPGDKPAPQRRFDVQGARASAPTPASVIRGEKARKDKEKRDKARKKRKR